MTSTPDSHPLIDALGEREARYWIWVFADAQSVGLVIESKKMYFSPSASARAAGIRSGDRALLYTTRGAFGNPNLDASRIIGCAAVSSATEEFSRERVFGGRPVRASCNFVLTQLAPYRTGEQFRNHVSSLKFLQSNQQWGQTLRRSPVEIPRSDFEHLHKHFCAMNSASLYEAMLSWKYAMSVKRSKQTSKAR